MQKVAFVSTCGSGHLNTLRSLWERDLSSCLFLVRFKNDPNPFENAEEDRLVIITLNYDRTDECAEHFNMKRSIGLHETLRVWIQDFSPTLVVYDFFCIEARSVARNMGIPAICSIPATLKSYQTDRCSDALLLEEHFYWIWRESYQVSIRPVAFLGPRHQEPCSHTRIFTLCYRQWENVVIVTFGTVVPKYDGCRERLGQIMVQVNQLAQQYPETLFVFAGMEVPQRINCLGGNDLNFPTLLTDKVKVVLFHGGGNTFAESLQARVPYFLACPFFGDQFETARQCGNVYSGDLLADWKTLRPYLYGPSLTVPPYQDTFVDYWNKGDLLFGHRRHRDALQKVFPMINFHLNHYAKFATFADPEQDLPGIADVYNDELYHPYVEDDQTEYGRRLKDVLEARRAKSFVDILSEDHRLVYYCIQIMRLMCTKWNGRIHFVIGPHDEIGVATQMELNAIKGDWKLFQHSVIAYNLEGKRIPFPLNLPDKSYSSERVKLLEHNEFSNKLVNIRGRMPLVWGREKTSESIIEKTVIRRLPCHDRFGWRTGYLNRDDLNFVLHHVDQTFTVSINWCKQRVWHFEYHSICTELQVWPWIYLHCFYLNMTGVETDRDYQHQVYEMIKDTLF